MYLLIATNQAMPMKMNKLIQSLKDRKICKERIAHTSSTNLIISDGVSVRSAFEEITKHLFNPRLLKELMERSRKQFNSENIEFLVEICNVDCSLSDAVIFGQLRSIYTKYILPEHDQPIPNYASFTLGEASHTINISYKMRCEFETALYIFADAYNNVPDTAYNAYLLKTTLDRRLEILMNLMRNVCIEVIKLVGTNKLFEKAPKKKRARRSITEVFNKR